MQLPLKSASDLALRGMQEMLKLPQGLALRSRPEPALGLALCGLQPRGPGVGISRGDALALDGNRLGAAQLLARKRRLEMVTDWCGEELVLEES